MKTWKPKMGVEGPSFYEFQQNRKKDPEQKPSKKKSFFDAIFGPQPQQATGAAAEIPNREARLRPGFHPREPNYVDANRWFTVPAIWDRVGYTISMHGNQAFIVDILTRPVYNATRAERELQSAGEIAQFFGIPPNEFVGLSLEQSWQNVIGPFFSALEESINRAKPVSIPGAIRFELEPATNELIMVYRDR